MGPVLQVMEMMRMTIMTMTMMTMTMRMMMGGVKLVWVIGFDLGEVVRTVNSWDSNIEQPF